MYPSISLYLILYYPLIPVKLGACGLLLYASSCSISSVKNVSTAVAVSLSTSVIVRSNHVPSGRSTVATIAQLVTLYFLVICILSLLCLVPVHGDELASIPTGVRPCAGLSFKSGYQQTGYVHTIGSYRMCQVLLLLGAWSLELGAWSSTIEDFIFPH